MVAPYGYVYFARYRELDAIKIGFSKHPVFRFRSLYKKMRLIGFIRASAATERRLHRQFDQHRLPDLCESFRYSPIVSDIDRILSPAHWRVRKAADYLDGLHAEGVASCVAAFGSIDLCAQLFGIPAEEIRQRLSQYAGPRKRGRYSTVYGIDLAAHYHGASA